ncbi:glycosyltransferase family 2 protein [Pseudomonadota bacterium]
MKLIIQIPCFNEEETLPIALAELPRSVEGFDEVEWLIIDDGSTDKTAEIARQHGVDHVIQFKRNMGLARGFMAGIKEALRNGADVIVNTDADNQYCADDIKNLVKPIVQGKADYVIGARPVQTTDHFSFTKKQLQRLGSWVVRKASGTDIPDAPSGFRAISSACAAELNVYNDYTYTLETIIQAGQKRMAITSVPIRTNEDLRPSRLFKSIPSYLRRSIGTIIRIFVVYQPYKFFMGIAAILLTIGILLGFRFLYFFLAGNGTGHIQSVILSGVLLITGFQTGLIAFVADLLSVNRKLLEKANLELELRNFRKD